MFPGDFRDIAESGSDVKFYVEFMEGAGFFLDSGREGMVVISKDIISLATWM